MSKITLYNLKRHRRNTSYLIQVYIEHIRKQPKYSENTLILVLETESKSIMFSSVLVEE